MYKKTLDKETLSNEIHYYAKRRYSFEKFIKGLRRDYNLKVLDNPENIKLLKTHYNTLLFMVEERTNRYNRVAA